MLADQSLSLAAIFNTVAATPLGRVNAKRIIPE